MGSGVVLGGLHGTGAQAAVDAEQARAVVADELELAHDLGDGGLLLDLLVQEPVQQRARVEVARGLGGPVQLADRLGDLLLVRERGPEDLQGRQAGLCLLYTSPSPRDRG